MFIFRKFVRELWPLIDVRIALTLNILRNSGLLLHAKHCSGAIVRFSDSSSFFCQIQNLFVELGKKHTFGIGNGAEYWPQNRMIKGPVRCFFHIKCKTGAYAID